MMRTIMTCRGEEEGRGGEERSAFTEGCASGEVGGEGVAGVVCVG